MQKMKRLNPYRKARLKYGRLIVESNFNNREMIALLKEII
jgi:hypothetical protein